MDVIIHIFYVEMAWVYELSIESYMRAKQWKQY